MQTISVGHMTMIALQMDSLSLAGTKDAVQI